MIADPASAGRARHGRNAAPASIEEFLVERYCAWTRRRGRDTWFPVWHPPWQIAALDAQFISGDLMNSTGGWWGSAVFHSAHWSPSAGDVWMGWRRRR